MIPPHYYGSRLEKVLAPRHAYLVWSGLPCGIELFQTQNQTKQKGIEQHGGDVSSLLSSSSSSSSSESSGSILFHELLQSIRNTNHFVAMCQKWQQQQQQQQQLQQPCSIAIQRKTNRLVTTVQHVEAFEMMFTKGIMAAVRNETIQTNNSWPRKYIPETELPCGRLVQLLIEHGASPYELDHRGVSLLHWACGAGTIDVVSVLLLQQQSQQQMSKPLIHLNCTVLRDGSTPLHWAAAGCTGREFGTGGHIEVCRLLLTKFQNDFVKDEKNMGKNKSNGMGSIEGCCSSRTSLVSSERTNIHVSSYVNAATKDGNTAVMWAAWSGSLDIVQYLVQEYQADLTTINNNGCTIAHWAASGGSLHVCKYLHDVQKVDFFTKNRAGNTPLSHSVAFGRTEIVQWLLQVEQKQKQQHLEPQHQWNNDTLLLRDSSFNTTMTYANDDDAIASAYHLAQEFVHWTDGNDPYRHDILKLFETEWGSRN